MAFDGDWHWALRGTPVLGLLAVILIVFVMKEPPRGEAEGHDQVPILPKVYKLVTCNFEYLLLAHVTFWLLSIKIVV
jgi:hypothetical protein